MPSGTQKILVWIITAIFILASVYQILYGYGNHNGILNGGLGTPRNHQGL